MWAAVACRSSTPTSFAGASGFAAPDTFARRPVLPTSISPVYPSANGSGGQFKATMGGVKGLIQAGGIPGGAARTGMHAGDRVALGAGLGRAAALHSTGRTVVHGLVQAGGVPSVPSANGLGVTRGAQQVVHWR